jgi:glycosyltransferase involved in cell wall biosynthesis
MLLIKKPLISIITPSWNRVKFLKKLARSLTLQKFKNFEWIIGNDGSTDTTDNFIKLFAKKADFKIIYINSSLRIGKAALDNIMLDYVSGKYISFCNSDDIMMPNAIENITKLISQIPKRKEKDYVGIFAQNIDTFNKSQTFHQNYSLKKNRHVKWEYLNKIIKGDGTIVERAELLKEKKFLEVDFLITESSLFCELYKNKKFILTPLIVKVMDRTAYNSVSFGKKLRYCRGSAYCIAKVETSINFDKHFFLKKIIIITNFWRYSIHGDINFFEAKKMLRPTDKNILYSILYLLALIVCLRDWLLNKVEKTHIEFDNNIKNTKISIKKYN